MRESPARGSAPWSAGNSRLAALFSLLSAGLLVVMLLLVGAPLGQSPVLAPLPTQTAPFPPGTLQDATPGVAHTAAPEGTPSPIAMGTPIGQSGVAPFPTVVPIHYFFYDSQNIDFARMFPGTGPLGSILVVPWNRIHVGDGQFDWTFIDTYLAAAQRMRITLDDGTVISKPVILEIIENESDVPSVFAPAPYPPLTAQSAYFVYNDFTPQFIRDQIRAPIAPLTWVVSLTPTITIAGIDNDGGSYLAVARPGMGSCTSTAVAVVPKYDNPTWQRFYRQMIEALGRRYDKDPRVTGIIFGPGIDVEFGQATKPFFECDVRSILHAQRMPERDYLALGVRPGPGNDAADWYRAAFPTKPIFLQVTSSGRDMVDVMHSDGHWPPIGIKQATLVHDNFNQWQSNGNGTLQLMMRYSTTHPIAWENALAFQAGPPRGNQYRYFMLLGGLMAFPAFFDFTGGWPIDREIVSTGMFDFARRYLGRSITTTDEVWIALRDTEYPPQPSGTTLSLGGWPSDFSYGLYRPDLVNNRAPVLRSAALAAPPFSLPYPITTHLYSLVARRTDTAGGNPYMSFAADHRWPFWGKVPRSVQSNGVWYDITIKYIDLGTDTLSLEYMDYSGRLRTRTIRKQDSRRWVTTTVQLYDAYLNGGLPGGTDLRISADPDRGGHDEIIHMIMIKGHAGGDPTPTPVPPPTPTPTPTPFYEVRVAAGNRAVRDRGGALWSADQPYTPGWWGYVGGAVYTTSVPVLADTPALFTTERFWREPGGYRFDVPNGVYQVDLAFAETLRTTPGQRVFDVLIEGTTVLRHFDIAAEVGVNRPVERSVLVSVSDGQLTIDFIPIADAAKVNALRVVAMPSPAMTATPTPTATRPTNQPDIGGTPTPPLEPTVTALEEHYLRTLSLVQRLLSILKGMFQP